MNRIVRVALPLPKPRLFDYLAAPETQPAVGRCVRLPFGAGEKTGVIVEVDPPQSISIDGEQIEPMTVKAHVLPQSVKVVVPHKEA